jgi:hypothetical protein
MLDADFQVVLNQLKDNEIEKLDLSHKGLTSHQITLLAEALKTNTMLKMLELSGNQIGDAGAEKLADALKSNTALMELGLSSNQIGNVGADKLADALKSNTTLTKLDLNRNQMNRNKCDIIVLMLAANCRIYAYLQTYAFPQRVMRRNILVLLKDKIGIPESSQQIFFTSLKDAALTAVLDGLNAEKITEADLEKKLPADLRDDIAAAKKQPPQGYPPFKLFCKVVSSQDGKSEIPTWRLTRR